MIQQLAQSPQVRNPDLNLTRAIVEGLDYEAIYVLDSSIFGHGDVGRLTFTLNGTYLSRFEFQPTPVSKRIGLSGEFVSGASFSGSLPHNRAYASIFYDGPVGTWLAGFDTGATVHYTGQYEDGNIVSDRIDETTNAEKWAFALASAESARVDYSRPSRILYV